MLTVLAAAVARAEDAAESDFSEGLERLAALGLPDMEGARWTGAAPADILRASPLEGWNFREVKIRPAGRVWQLPGGEARYLHFGGISPATAEGEAPTAGDSPLETDIRHLVKALDRAASEAAADSFSRNRFEEIHGPLLIFAAQVHRAGHPDEANRLVSALFRTGADRVTVIDRAVGRFADERFEDITERFFEDHDWAAYHRDLEALLEKFPRGWEKRLAVAILLPRVAARAAGDPVPDPEPPGVPLGEAALAAVRQWSEPPGETSAAPSDELETLAAERGIDLADVPAEYRPMLLAQLRDAGGGFGDTGSAGLWLLDPPAADAAADAVEKTRSLGFEALPVLAALTADETLTHRPNSSSSGGGVFYYSQQSEAERARAHYQTLARPRTRGEIAVDLLVPVIPGFERSDGESPIAVRDAALDFWRGQRDAAPSELARVYLTEGTDGQRQGAAEFLAASDDPEAWAIFEKAVLGAPDILEMAAVVRTYLESRKAEARSFFETFAERVREAMDGVDIENLRYDSSARLIASAGGVEEFLGPLAVIAGASSVGELLDRAVAAGADDAEAWNSLAEALSGSPLVELFEPFGERLADAGAAVRTRLLEAFLNRAARWTIDDRNAPPAAGDLAAETAALWRAPLEDDSRLAEPTSNSWLAHYGMGTVAEATGLVLEFAFNQEAGPPIHRATLVFGESGGLADLVRARAAARFEGAELPPFPSHEALPDARKREIEAMITASEPVELREKVLALDPDERDFWIEWREGPWDEGTEMPEALRRLRRTVTHLPPGGENGDDDESGRGFLDRLAGAVRERARGDTSSDLALLELLGIAPGFRIDAQALETLAESLLREAGAKSGALVQFGSAPLSLGLGATARRAGETRDNWMQFFANHELVTADDQADAYACAYVADNLIVWGIRDGEIRAITERVDGEFPAFGELQTFFESPNPAIPTFAVAVLTRDDLRKHQTSN